MPDADATAASPEGLEALRAMEEAFEIAYALVARIGADQWHLPTPCAEWDVRMLVNHIVGGADMVRYGLEGRPIGREFYGDHLGDDPVASHRAAIDAVLAAYRADLSVLDRDVPMPWGDVTGARLADMFMGDHLVHAWDVARATGQVLTADPALVARAQALSLDYVGEVRRGPEMFDGALRAPDDADEMDRLAAYLGRVVD